MKQLATGYFIASNLPIDENVMTELDQVAIIAHLLSLLLPPPLAG